jgi:imidazolonepropionase-like amidohydrolase
MTNEQEKAVQVVRDALAYARRTGLTNDQAFQAATADPAPSLKGSMDVLSGGSIPPDGNPAKSIPSGKNPAPNK